jgi:hypothetical protein
VAKEVSVLAVKDNHCYQFPVMIASCITVGTMNRMANERAQAEGMNHRVGNHTVSFVIVYVPAQEAVDTYSVLVIRPDPEFLGNCKFLGMVSG